MSKRAALNLSSIAPIYILPTHVSTEDLHQYEDQVYAAGGTLTYNPKEARIFLGKISQKKRAALELRSNGIWTEEGSAPIIHQHATRSNSKNQPEKKRRKLNPESKTTSSSDSSGDEDPSPDQQPVVWPDLSSHVLFLKLEWFDLSLKHKAILPYTPHLVYSGKINPKPPQETSPSSKTSGTVTYIKATPESTSTSTLAASHTPRRFHSATPRPVLSKPTPPKLHRTTTSEHDETSRPVSPSRLPPLPEWAKSKHAAYSCCRSTLMQATNASFIAVLSTIKLHRVVILDEIGVRAYSTAIASLSAYPHTIQSEAEVIRLPGCSQRIAELWREWFDSGDTESERSIQHVRDLENDADIQTLKLFYNIWGVGADTARKFLFTHGFKDLDDLVEYHWSSLTRVQQIGVKFYDEFLIPLPRNEVEDIARVIHRHARSVCSIDADDFGGPNDVVCVIVGGYRRGKAQSGDVDVILSHRDESLTKDLVVDVVRSLEAEGWITHTLTLQTTTSQRDQQTLPFRGKGGHGFDFLDKALCVWQDPNFPPPSPSHTPTPQAASSSSASTSANPNPHTDTPPKNTNLHRRVDIILSPWRTVGCAILGWSGGTTFQRDLRRFAQREKGWKFDSSGIRDRGSGVVVDLEKAPPSIGKEGGVSGGDGGGGGGKGDGKGKERGDGGGGYGEGDGGHGDTWLDREMRVMDGLGVGWRDASERCTG